MENNIFVIQIIQALRWPVVVVIIFVIICFLFRRQIGAIILRITRMRYRDVELEFGRGLNEVEDRASEAGIPTMQETQLERPVDEALHYIATIAPRASVVEAWLRLETTLFEAAERLHIPVGPLPGMRVGISFAGRKVISRLVDDGKLSKGTLDIFEKLRRLRNLAAHSLDYELNSDEANRYVELALNLASKVRSSTQN